MRGSRRKTPKGALEKALAAREKCPTSDNALLAIARIQLQLGAKSEALSAIRRAVELNPNNKKQIPLNKDFAPLSGDPEFLAIVGLN